MRQETLDKLKAWGVGVSHFVSDKIALDIPIGKEGDVARLLLEDSAVVASERPSGAKLPSHSSRPPPSGEPLPFTPEELRTLSAALAHPSVPRRAFSPWESRRALATIADLEVRYAAERLARLEERIKELERPPAAVIVPFLPEPEPEPKKEDP